MPSGTSRRRSSARMAIWVSIARRRFSVCEFDKGLLQGVPTESRQHAGVSRRG